MALYGRGWGTNHGDGHDGGIGDVDCAIMLVPSGSGVSSMENSVTLKPLSLFKPRRID